MFRNIWKKLPDIWTVTVIITTCFLALLAAIKASTHDLTKNVWAGIASMPIRTQDEELAAEAVREWFRSRPIPQEIEIKHVVTGQGGRMEVTFAIPGSSQSGFCMVHWDGELLHDPVVLYYTDL